MWRLARGRCCSQGVARVCAGASPAPGNCNGRNTNAAELAAVRLHATLGHGGQVRVADEHR